MGRQAAAIGAEIERRIAFAVKAFVLELDKRLRKATPVDTGHARRNWVPSIGSPATIETDDESARAAGVQSVLSYRLQDGVVWLSNAAPYIDALNYGHSQQAPAGFIEQAVAEAQAHIQQKLGVRVEITGTMSAWGRDQAAGDAAANLADAYNPLGGDE